MRIETTDPEESRKSKQSAVLETAHESSLVHASALQVASLPLRVQEAESPRRSGEESRERAPWHRRDGSGFEGGGVVKSRSPAVKKGEACARLVSFLARDLRMSQRQTVLLRTRV